MANKTVFFTTGDIVKAAVLKGLQDRIKHCYSKGSLTAPSLTAPTAGTTKITFADLNTVYTTAKNGITKLGGSTSRTLGSFQGKVIKGTHGIGIAEKTVGDLEQICVGYKNANKASNNVTQCSNVKAATGTNSGNSASFSGNSASHSGNKSGNSASFSGNFSGNGAAFSGNRSGGYAHNYTSFHTSQGGTKAAVHSPNHKSNWSGNSASFSGNCSGNSASHSGNNSGNSASHSSNKSGYHSGNKSGFSAAVTTFGANHSANFKSNTKTCIVVHSTFSVQGVDF